MHFTYAVALDKTNVMQGDVLKRTQEIDKLLKEVHPHFFHNNRNLFFIVLTQSCDLVSRNGEDCKSPYITIAPVRSIDEVIRRQVDSLQIPSINSEAPILTDKAKTKLSEFVKRLYNNNEPGYFFLESCGTELQFDCCACLNLSIAIKASEHYKKCLEAKIIELESSFQAKLGWLVGQQYSRVGTQDWPEGDLPAKINSAIKDLAIWIPDAKSKALESVLRSRDTNEKLTVKEVRSILRGLPKLKNEVVKRVAEVINEVLGPQETQQEAFVKKVQKRLENDPALATLLK